MKRVAVIGGGPAGLAAAKALLDSGLCPVIFEATSSLGGLWARRGLQSRVWDTLRTNLTKYTCCFADLPYPERTPLYPSHEEVADYLQTYSDKFLGTAGEDRAVFRFNTRVTKLSRDAESGQYRLHCLHAPEEDRSAHTEQVEHFDKVVVATGFFSQRYTHSNTHTGTHTASESTIYADQYRSPHALEGRTAVVVGGSFSGCEIAADIARVARKVYHIVPHYTFVLPRFLPLSASSSATPFLPMDFVFYSLSEERQKALRGENVEEKNFEILFKSEEDALKTTSYLSSLLHSGNRFTDPLAELASDFLSPSSSSSSSTETARQRERPTVAISDEYKSMRRAGRIEVLHGKFLRVESVEGTETESRIVYEKDGVEKTLSVDSPAQTVLCCGYSPDLSFLDEDLLSALQYDETNAQYQPLRLYKELFHPAVRNLFFVGMYKGPYFGVMELQAKLAAKYILGEKALPSAEETERGLAEAERLAQTRPRTQFPHADYVGMLLDLGKELQCLPVPSGECGEKKDIVVPNWLTSPSLGERSAESVCVLQEIESEVEKLKKGKFIARAMIYALEGAQFSLQREIFDKDSLSISTVTGKVDFSLITTPQPEKFKYRNGLKHLWYHEEGVFSTAKGGKFDVSQSYVYAYNKDFDTLDIFFSTVGNPTAIDRPFLSLSFEPQEGKGWVASAKHLCGEDNYYAQFEIAFSGINITRMYIVFDVLGPAKNYRSSTVFTLNK